LNHPGKNDNFIDLADAQQSYAVSSQPKKIDWYDVGHTLNDQATKDRLAWLETQLILSPTPRN
jgi:hypothetical protein